MQSEGRVRGLGGTTMSNKHIKMARYSCTNIALDNSAVASVLSHTV